jgi:hypothetical protein
MWQRGCGDGPIPAVVMGLDPSMGPNFEKYHITTMIPAASREGNGPPQILTGMVCFMDDMHDMLMGGEPRALREPPGRSLGRVASSSEVSHIVRWDNYHVYLSAIYAR